MKYKFGNDNLITGYIKNLLHEFNLPQAKVITDDNMPKFKGKYYIKNRKIYYGVGNNKIEQVGVYNFGDKIPNLTKNLVINSSKYDSYTHTYLGEFLRFIRDYKGLNLMPLYNCFNNETPYRLKFTLDIPHVIESSEGDIEEISYFRVDTESNLYNYYLVPIKFNTKYNIAIESTLPYEICAMIYTGSQRLKISNQLMKLTHTLIGNSRFSHPYTFRVDVDDTPQPKCNYERYTDYEENLRLLIKIPKTIKSTITIIEGDILTSKSYGDTITSRLVYNEEEVIRLNNGEAYPDRVGEVMFKPEYEDLMPNTNLSLLSLDDGVSYPFADRLVEYLLRNAINHTEKLQNNISRIQSIIYPKLGDFKGFYDIWNIDINYKIHDFINQPIKNNSAIVSKIDPNNISDKLVAYKDRNSDGELIVDYSTFTMTDTYKDLLGYIDKDVEYHLEVL